MNPHTKLVRQVNQVNFQIKKKIWVFQKIVIFSIFSLFLGFVFGNLFGTFLNFFRFFIHWDGLIILLLISLIEFINYINYKKPNKLTFYKPLLSHKSNVDYFSIVNQRTFRSITKLTKQTSNQKILVNQYFGFTKKIKFIKILNFYKTGLLLGFFIDAFKVGS